MSKEYCNYHPAKPSVWRCKSCRIPFCPECVPGSRENYDGETPRCALCNEPLTYLGGANMAEPFWTQAGTFFGYPLKTTGLMTLGFIALTSALLPVNLIGIIGLVFLAALTIHYGLRIIDSVRQGQLEPPRFTEMFQRDSENLFFKQIAVIIMLTLFVGAANYLGTLIFGLTLVFVLLAIPASTMLLAMTSSVLEAVNPRNLALLMLRIGPTYLLLWFCLMVVAAGPTLVTPMLVELLPQRALFPVSMAVSAYFTFVTYAMMGYILYEKQAKLGFTSDDDFGEHLEYKQFMVRRALANARILAGANRYEQALDVLRTGIGIDEANAELRELYYRVVSTTNDAEAIRRNTNSICEFFIARRAPAKAAYFFLETRKHYPDFTPSDSAACHRIAEHCFEHGKVKEAAGLLLKLHKTAPEYPEMVSALILMARIFFEGMNARDKAIALLKQLQTRHPDHPESARMQRLLEIMNHDSPASA